VKEIRGLDQGDASDPVTTLPVTATGAAAARAQKWPSMGQAVKTHLPTTLTA